MLQNQKGLIRSTAYCVFITLLISTKWTDGKRSYRHRFEDIGLNCFTCVSINGTDKDCDDPVQPAWMNPTKDCKTPVPVDFNKTEYENLNETIKTQYEYFAQRTWKKERANFCLKVVGTSDTKESVVIRTCIMEDMNSQCGSFKFRERQIRGCMLTCDKHLCNGASANTLFDDRNYEELYDLFNYDRSFLKVLLGIRMATMIPMLLIGRSIFFGDRNGGWWWNVRDQYGLPSSLYAGG